jgi:hypothetical protein
MACAISAAQSGSAPLKLLLSGGRDETLRIWNIHQLTVCIIDIYASSRPTLLIDASNHCALYQFSSVVVSLTWQWRTGTQGYTDYSGAFIGGVQLLSGGSQPSTQHTTQPPRPPLPHDTVPMHWQPAHKHICTLSCHAFAAAATLCSRPPLRRNVHAEDDSWRQK